MCGMSTPRQPLYQRLPEIYRIKDAEQTPPGQLEAYLDVIESVYGAIRDNIETRYHDHFIETCDDWVIPYLADLLGTSHLSGVPWTLRADVARTVHHRRRKGTPGAVESLSFTLTGWAAHAVELRDRLLWNQHLNHPRPDAGGQPPLRLRAHIAEAARGGSVNLRDPALLSFLDGPFDPFAHVVDLKPLGVGRPRDNLPNLAVFLWRLRDYQVPVSQPGLLAKQALAPADPGEAAWAVRAVVHPLAEPMVLFNTHRFHADDDPPQLTRQDEVPGPMPLARLSQDTLTGRPEQYLAVELYGGGMPPAPAFGSVGLTLHLPEAAFAGHDWRFRGANLCAWEEGLNPPLRESEIVVDPQRGRVLFGVAGEAAEADPLLSDLRISPTYGFSGPTGAHPAPRPVTPTTWLGRTPVRRTVNHHDNPDGLRDALADLPALAEPLIIEITDSMTHRLDLTTVSGIGNEAGEPTLRLGRSLWLRARSGQRPVIVLQQPLRLRPDDVTGPDAPAIMAGLNVRLEGLYITWDRDSVAFAADTGLIRQAALNRLVLDGCTLDPGGSIALDGTAQGSRQPIRTTLQLGADYGFSDAAEQSAFDQIPELALNRSICGVIEADEDYRLSLTDSLVDGGSGVGDSTPDLAIGAAGSDPDTAWGPPLEISGVTCFGRVRVASVTGQGGIFVHRLQAHDNQRGCVKFSYFSGSGNRLPPHHACVFGPGAALSVASHVFGEAGYGQLRLRSDRRLFEQGPGRDAMGAFGYLRNTHKWKNLNIRYREFLPVGVRVVLVPVT
jgi:hypothetical protein